jgi:hypothetical protein
VTVLLLDMSGSMSDNDPDDIRCAAARTFIGLSRPGEQVGLIGFGGTQATAWTRDARPVEATGVGRAELESDVSANCVTPSGNTPTYDALDQAWRQLDSVPGGGARSVVLLTDGVPTGDRSSSELVSQIEQDLVPRFSQRGWRIDTVALGTDDTDFAFLARIAAATGGTYYDSSRGSRANALNLLPAFVDVLRQEPGRSPGQDVPGQSAAGPLTFTVTPAAKHLDVIVVCRTQCAITLRTPAGASVQQLQPVSPGVGRPGYGAVFSVDQPTWLRDGGALVPWSVGVQGGDMVAVQSLVDLELGIDLQPGPSPHALGRSIGVSATLREADGTPYVDSTLIVTGSARRGNGGGALSFGLSSVGAARYLGTLLVPATWQPGDYTLTVAAAHDSGEEPVATAQSVVAVGLFPIPTLDSATTATRWPGLLTAIYSLPVVDRFAGWALRGVPAAPTAVVSGTLSGPDGASYERPAMVSADVTGGGRRSPVAAAAASAGPGRFRLTFPASAAGNYDLVLHTGGVDSYGETETTPVTVQVAMRDASAAQVGYAALATAVLALLLIALLGCIRFFLMRPPFGRWRAGEDELPEPLARRRSPLRAFLWRNRVESRDPAGLEFKFTYRAGVLVRARPHKGTAWRLASGAELPRRFSQENELLHDGTVYTIVEEDEWTWRHWAAALARAVGLPVRPPRSRAESSDEDDPSSFIY